MLDDLFLLFFLLSVGCLALSVGALIADLITYRSARHD